MLRRMESGWWILGGILLLRLVSMAIYPLADTTEARYAEVARWMAERNDWVTLWFDADTPFWGKPPLAFWTEALSFQWLGVNEFAARFPSWIALILGLGLLYRAVRHHFGPQSALNTLLIYSSMALVHVGSGAVMTDPFLALSTTAALCSLFMSGDVGGRRRWGYGFFMAVAFGLLAKGPLVVVLIGLAILPTLGFPEVRHRLRCLPWGSGLLLTFALSVPWYVLAERRTPGFLDYFLVGEHFRRFVDPGWNGDLYGNAHEQPLGMIWPFFLMASFPWALVAGVAAYHGLKRRRRFAGADPSVAPLRRWTPLMDWRVAVLISWMLAPLVFFSPARNLLWTYALPALAPASVLLGVWLTRFDGKSWGRTVALQGGPMIVPGLLLIFSLWSVVHPERTKTEKFLVSYAFEQMAPGDDLAFVDKRPFSAQFYSHGEAGELSRDALLAMLPDEAPAWLAVPREEADAILARLAPRWRPWFESRRYTLLGPVEARSSVKRGDSPALYQEVALRAAGAEQP